MRRTTILLLCGLATALLCACREPAAPAAGAWRHLDLAAETPTVEASAQRGLDDDAGGTLSYRAVVGYLGSREVRDLARVPASQLTAFPHQNAGQAAVIEQAPGSRLAWHVTLGQTPVFTFTPLADDDQPCPCTFRAGLRTATGEIVELFRHPTGAAGARAAAPAEELPAQVAQRGTGMPVELDLSPWAGQQVDLLLQVEPPPGGSRPGARARWASPALFDRSADPGTGRPRTGGPPNIVLIGIDTLRADHVGAWGDGAETAWQRVSLTPAIDRLAADSDLWLDAYSTFNVTNPSFASILTGLYGKNHGVYDLQTPLPAGHTTLAELLSDAGYATLAVISASHLGDHNSGLGQGFDTVVTASEHAAAERSLAVAMDWIAAQDGPYFVWLHLFDPHTPHTPPQPYASGLRPAAVNGPLPVTAWIPFRPVGPVVYEQPVLGGHRDLYAGEVAYLDRQLGRFVGFLDSRGAAADTVLALTSDHGENLGEHGILDRHIGLWETTTHVPLMIRWPTGPGSHAASRGRRFHGLVQTLDLFPTLLAAAGLTPPPQDGEDLRQLTADGRRGRRAVFAEHASLLGLTVRTATHRLMKSAGNPQVRDGSYLFDLTNDPQETRNLTGLATPTEKALADLLTRWLNDRRPTEQALPRQLSQEEIERLRALGYL